jgi:hypothetical protein
MKGKAIQASYDGYMKSPEKFKLVFVRSSHALKSGRFQRSLAKKKKKI